MARTAFSADRLARLHDVLQSHVAMGVAPGLVALVSRHGETHVEAIGATAVEGGQPMRHDTIFRIASVTKPITAAAAMILVEECKLRLDDPVDELLPELANRQVLRGAESELDDTVPATRPITVRDLLASTMGLGMSFSSNPPSAERAMWKLLLGFEDPLTPPPPDEWMRRLGTLPLMAQPGKRWLYHLSYDVLGVLIARASGQDLQTFMRQRIFAPLGMKDTGFWVSPEQRDRLAALYLTDPAAPGGLTLADGASDSKWSAEPTFPAGAGGLVSTVDDLHAFGQMMLHHGVLGRQRILSRPSVTLMMSDHLTPAQKAISPLADDWQSHGWGFGGSVVTRQDSIAETSGTYGWEGGFGTSWYIDPLEDTITILLTQATVTTSTPPAIARDFRTLAYAAMAN